MAERELSARGVTCVIENGLGLITLARPERSNALDLRAADAFMSAVEQTAADEVRAVLVRGEGERFCAGGDVVSMAAASDPSSYLFELAGRLGEVLARLSALTKPVIAAVHGAVAGAGLAVLLSCDVVIAARETKFAMAYAGVGLTPDCGVSYLLPRAVGQQRALELAITGRALTAAEAYGWGMVTELAEDPEAAYERGLSLAREMAAAPSYALAQAKRLIRQSWTVTPAASLADEAKTISRAVREPTAQLLIEKFTNAGSHRS